MGRILTVIIDKKAGDIIGPIIAHRSEQVAIRDFTDVVMTENSRLAMHPEDYALVQLGVLHDDHFGKFDIESSYREIVSAETLINLNKAAQAERDKLYVEGDR